jgi:hypothetical protein
MVEILNQVLEKISTHFSINFEHKIVSGGDSGGIYFEVCLEGCIDLKLIKTV